MTIASVVIATAKTLEEITSEYEIIVVDDGSRDATPDMLQELLKLYPNRLRVVRHPVNRGYGGALKTGISAAKYDWIFYSDGDAQYDVRELSLLAPQARENVDAVNGYKISRSDPMYRKVIGACYNQFVRFAFRINIRDVDCDFRLMRRSLFDNFELTSTSGTICVEMVKKLQDAGCRFAEVPVHHFHRSVGRSQFFRPRWLLKTFRDLMALWYELMVRTPEQRRRADAHGVTVKAAAAAGANGGDDPSRLP